MISSYLDVSTFWEIHKIPLNIYYVSVYIHKYLKFL